MSYILDIVERELGEYKWAGETDVMCRCPFHKGGQERSASFAINIESGLWTCYTCWMGGGLAKLLYELGYKRDTVDAVLDPIRHLLTNNRNKKKQVKADPWRGAFLLPEEILGLYDYDPIALLDDGFDEDLLRDLDVGFDRANRRITWPLRDTYGNLIGFSGRLRQDDPLRERVGKYKVYKKELAEMYPGYKRPSHNFLWGMDRIFHELDKSEEQHTVYVVEGFKAATWLMQHGFRRSVALMTTQVSNIQLQLLEWAFPKIVLFLDGDDPGQLGTWRGGRRMMSRGLQVHVPIYPSFAKQPDDLSPDDLVEVIEDAVPWNTWKRQLSPELKTQARELEKKKGQRT